MSENSLPTPFRRGDTVLIPKGTLIRSTHPGRRKYLAGRTHRVKVWSSWPGSVSLENERGKVHFPSITWPGSGGYWCDVQLTPELAEANSVPMPELPGQDGRLGVHALDVIPSYQDGYTDRWEPLQ